MCGFCGFIGQDENKEDKIKKMMDKIIYRGPDSSGMHIDEEIALGFRRLAIIDLKEGHQPIYNEDGNKVIVFNGEIYNYQEIKEDLLKKGHKFTTKTDTEILLHGYEEYKEELLNKLRGMFTFAIWDKQEKELFIARDFFGIKPMYYVKQENELVFGSEIKCVLEHPKVEKKLNRNALDNYLTFQYSVPNDTFFEGIKCLPPGHYLKYKDGQIVINKYYEVKFEENKSLTLEKAVDEIEKVFKDSVEAHKISDVEVGCFLSSGIDSSYVASNFKGQKTFTVGFEYDNYNEIGYAQELSKEIGCDHHYKVISTEEYWNSIPQIQYYMDQPLADPSCIALYFVSKMASEHVKVVLSGEGADEFFGGYNIYNEPFSLKPTKILPRWVWKIGYNILNVIPGNFKGKNFVRRASLKLEERFIGNANLLSVKERRKLLKHVSENEVLPTDITRPFYEKVKEQDDVTKMQYIDIHLWMVGDILLKADRMSMANSLELRVPFLDKEVFNVARTLPTNLKVNNGTTKYALREAAKRNIPEKVAMKKKLGFPVPTRVWLREEKYYNIVKEQFTSNAAEEYFNEKELLKLLEDHYKGKKDNGRKIWTIYVFLVWHKKMFLT